MWAVQVRGLWDTQGLARSVAVRQLLLVLGGERVGHRDLHVLRQGGLLPLRGEAGPGHRQGGQLGGQSLLLLT